MKKLFLIPVLIVFSHVMANAQWVTDSTNTPGVYMYGASTSTRAVFSNGGEWNVYDAAAGTHTFGNFAVSRGMIEVVSYNDKVYFGGGKYGSFADPQYSKTVEVYDNATNTWSTLNLSTNREVGGAGAIAGKIVFAGGTGRVDIAGPVYMYNKVDIFDAVTGTRTTAKLGKARTNIAVGAAGNKIVFAGGWYWDMMYSTISSNNVDIYDVPTNTWTKTTLSSKRDNITAAVAGPRIVFAGGTSTLGAALTAVDVYNTSTLTWSTTNMPEANYGMKSVTVGNKIYFAGGMVGTANAIYRYTTTTGAWTTLYMPVTLTGFSMSVINNHIYFAGGTIPGTSTYSDLVQVYDPTLGTWSTLYLSQARTGVAAATVGSKGFFAGGTIVYGYPNPTNTRRVDIYTAPPRMESAELNTDPGLNVWPNPAFDQINIGVTNTAVLPALVELFDLNGRMISTFEITNDNYQVNIAALPRGTYILHMTDVFDHQFTHKIIKQ